MCFGGVSRELHPARRVLQALCRRYHPCVRRLLTPLLGLLLAVACTSGGGHAAPTIPGPSTNGRPNPLGAKWDWSRLDAFTPYLRTLAGGATFYELTWCEIEPSPGQRDWTAVDRVARSSKELGFELYLKLRTGSCWATGSGGQSASAGRRQARKATSAMPADLGAYARFVTDLVKRYAPLGVHEYAVENEVNASGHWSGTPADYEHLVRAAGEAVHAADPSARVADGGLGSTVYGQAIAARLLADGHPDGAVAAYQRYYARRFDVRGDELPRASNPAELRDALATDQARRNQEYLDATLRLVAARAVDVFQLHFYERWDNTGALTDLLHARLPAATPVQAWEVGQFWPGAPDDEHAHADELQRTVNGLLDGGVARVIWLPLAYNPNGRNPSELRFGLVDPDGRVRESGRVFEQVAVARARS